MQVKVEKIVPGGAGLARTGGKIVFVPGALPGEMLDIQEKKSSSKSYSESNIVQILDASPARRDAPCAIYGDCGGCDLQHARETLQTEIKHGIISDTLRRQAKLSPDEQSRVMGLMQSYTGQAFGYRNRVQFHRGPTGRPGFKKRRSNSVVELETCPIAAPEINAWLSTRPMLPETTAAAPGGGNRTGDKNRVRSDGIQDDPMYEDEFSPDRFPVFGQGGEAWVSGEQVTLTLRGKKLLFSNRSFFQSNIEMLDELLSWLIRELEESFGAADPGRELKAVDLYSGVGLFASFLPERFTRIEAVDLEEANTRFATLNTDPARTAVLKMSVDEWIGRQNGDTGTLDLAIVDPPRSGLSAALRTWLNGSGPATLVYVSCDPVTFARDLGELVRYRVERFAFFDFYPQTSRIETACLLKRV